ncbi:MAG: superoxide dismutase family protein [Chloroflexi bacterium]|nr:superoxide dismutase family protein [Chloroflexota bacterium]
MRYLVVTAGCLACIALASIMSVQPVASATSGAPAIANIKAQAVTTTVPITSASATTATGDMTGTTSMTDTTGITATGPMSAEAQLKDAQGNDIGTATFSQTSAGSVLIQVSVSGLISATAGEHGIHIHQVGKCTPDFQAAGEHYNPMMAKHGLQNPKGAHAGDLPNITFDTNGNATYTATTTMITLGNSPTSILVADGSAIVIHAKADDQKSDPSGKSDGRIACGVIAAAPASEPPPPIEGYAVQPEQRAVTPARMAQLKVPAGFTVKPFATDLANVRMMAQAADGTIYVTRRAQGDVLALRDENNDGMAEAPITVTTGLTSVHGILIQDDQLYLATPTTIYVSSLITGGGIGDLQVFLGQLPDGGQHGNRTLAFGPDGLLYVTVGSSCNSCSETNKEHATILQVQPDGSSRTIFAKGLRNTMGFGWHPTTGEMWGMDHGSDWRGNDQPPEELNQLKQGANYGWPYCFGDKKVDQYLSSPPVGLTKAEFCAQSTAPTLTYQAHSAPIGMVFYTGTVFPRDYQNDAFVAMRGSWNREQPTGYKVVRIHFANGKPVSFSDFLTGFLIENGKAIFGRPAGLLVLQDGSMLLSDDTGGVIYRITYAAP